MSLVVPSITLLRTELPKSGSVIRKQNLVVKQANMDIVKKESHYTN